MGVGVLDSEVASYARSAVKAGGVCGGKVFDATFAAMERAADAEDGRGLLIALTGRLGSALTALSRAVSTALARTTSRLGCGG